VGLEVLRGEGRRDCERWRRRRRRERWRRETEDRDEGFLESNQIWIIL